jgi:hypothetical protein
MIAEFWPMLLLPTRRTTERRVRELLEQPQQARAADEAGHQDNEAVRAAAVAQQDQEIVAGRGQCAPASMQLMDRRSMRRMYGAISRAAPERSPPYLSFARTPPAGGAGP